MSGAIPPLPKYGLKAWCSVKEKYRDYYYYYYSLTFAQN